MFTLKNHQLIGADFQDGYSWHEDQCAGLGMEFAAEFRDAYQKLRRGALLYSIRFSNIRRLNRGRFPYGIFYTIHQNEIRVLALLHGSRETKGTLAERRRTFLANRF
jgi:toxin ParE1/3/4